MIMEDPLYVYMLIITGILLVFTVGLVLGIEMGIEICENTAYYDIPELRSYWNNDSNLLTGGLE